MTGSVVKRSRPGVQSVERAIAILRSFSVERPERGVGELSRELGLHKSTVSRLMTTLERGGLLRRSAETQRYRLGIDLIGLAAQVVGYLDVRQMAHPYLRRLSEECQESVNLVVLDVAESGDEQSAQVVNLEQFIPRARQVKNIGRVGRRMAPHCTAAGKVLLAYLAPEQQEQVLPDTLETYTPHTATTRGELQRDLARVRAQGYAIVQEELEEGLNAVAAPIHDHTGSVIAAASIAGPAYRLTPKQLPHLARQLSEVTAKISRELGFSA